MRTPFHARVIALSRRIFPKRIAVIIAQVLFRCYEPSMIKNVRFIAVDAGGTSRFDPEPVWMVVNDREDGAYRLEGLGTKVEVLAALRMRLKQHPHLPLIIDRSFLRLIGTTTPSHPMLHSSFSLWAKGGIPENRGREVHGHVSVSPDTFWVR